ncbi:MAG: hypothetical protein ACRBCJ_05445 [Hyphomicrobiaceae bacterium]
MKSSKTHKSYYWSQVVNSPVRSIIFGIGLSFGLSACGSVSVPLPDLAKKPTVVMTPQQQAEAIADMNQHKATHEQKIVEDIESQREI